VITLAPVSFEIEYAGHRFGKKFDQESANKKESISSI
jgi:hypothetical protein